MKHSELIKVCFWFSVTEMCANWREKTETIHKIISNISATYMYKPVRQQWLCVKVIMLVVNLRIWYRKAFQAGRRPHRPPSFPKAFTVGSRLLNVADSIPEYYHSSSLE